jgi:Tol biopolymer transport system component
MNRHSGNIFILTLSDNELEQITHDDNSIAGLAWTEDSREIVYSSNREGFSKSLWRISASGGRPDIVMFGGNTSLIYPSISLEGQYLAYAQDNENLNIWRIDLKESEGKKIVKKKLIKSRRDNFGAEYSPDGAKIVFTSTRTGHQEIWICNSEGTNPNRITNLNTWAGAPTWSFPDGKWIAFALIRENRQNIYKVKINGGQPEQLSKGFSIDHFPSWSRDGRWIYFRSDRSGENQIWKIPAQGGKAEQVTFKGAYSDAVESFDRKWIYYSKGEKGIWKKSLVGNEENSIIEYPIEDDFWTLAENGIYYIITKGDSLNYITYYDFESENEIRQYEISEKGILYLTVSPDQRWLLYTQIDQEECKIMLLENFN